VLIEAHAQVLSSVPNAHLVLAGDGPCRPELESLAAKLGLAASTHFLGRRGDVDAIIRALNVGVMSSDFEGTPLFALECLTNRTPLVATAVGGLLDIIESGRTGILVPPRQPGPLAEAISALLLDPERRRRLADGAAEKLALYSMDAIVARFTELYEALAAQALAG
jgi:glycosyltransferase involved in cell wall biosynthesis